MDKDINFTIWQGESIQFKAAILDILVTGVIKAIGCFPNILYTIDAEHMVAIWWNIAGLLIGNIGWTDMILVHVT